MKRRPPAFTARRRLLLAGLCLTGALVAGRAFQLQVLESRRWRERAEDQHRERMVLPAPRGTIYDRDGVVLVGTREVVRIAVAPREVEDAARTRRELVRALGITEREARRFLDRSRRWVVLPGRHDVSVRQRLEDLPGVYFERVLERFYPHRDLALEVIGRVTGDGRAAGGLELELDSLLRGRDGLAVVRRDARGRPLPGALLTAVEPEPGRDVYLTLDYDLQEIAHGALRDAVEQTGAEGGDLLLVDPHNGDLLAAASMRRERRGWPAVTEPYEPGSTIKPFIVAALLAEGRATLSDTVWAEMGTWRDGARTISDTDEHGWLTLGEALRVSSNIAMAKMAERLTLAAEYVYLRDFGFGAPTGVPYPSESAGTLRRPETWSRYSQQSLAIGYEMAVTPLQMALAYAALANGGVLMEPRLVREVRTPAGEPVRAFEPLAVRRVLPGIIADSVTRALVEVVEDGTGQEAALGPFRVAGKTGTARVFEGGAYRRGVYTASFAGFFPADDPQIAFLVKLDGPQGQYYGGLAAAPVMRATLTAALASRWSPLNRGAVAAATPSLRGLADAEDETSSRVVEPGATGPFIFALEAGPPERYVPRRRRDVQVPRVAGLPLRDAVRRLHGSGFHVEIRGGGAARATAPAAGVQVAPGSTVVIVGAEEG